MLTEGGKGGLVTPNHSTHHAEYSSVKFSANFCECQRNQNGFQGQNILSKLLFENWNEFKPAPPSPPPYPITAPGCDIPWSWLSLCPCSPANKMSLLQRPPNPLPPGENILARTGVLAREGWFSPGNSLLQTLCARADARRIPVKIGRSEKGGEYCICSVIFLQQKGYIPFARCLALISIFPSFVSLVWISHFLEGISIRCTMLWETFL